MGKPRDGKVPILPSTTRRGTTLNTSAALDSPSVMSKLLIPPHAHATATTSVEFENATDNLDDTSTVLDESGSLGEKSLWSSSFLEPIFEFSQNQHLKVSKKF
jgi:hypothetical protein